MPYKLTVADVIELPVKFSLNDAGKTQSHSFHLSAKRMSQESLRAVMDDEGRKTRDLLQEQITGWRGQRLVVDDSEQPADFNADAFDCLLSLVGMEQIVLVAYLQGLSLADSQSGKAKN